MRIAEEMRKITDTARLSPRRKRKKNPKYSYKSVLAKIKRQAECGFNAIHLAGIGRSICDRLKKEGFELEYTAYNNVRGVRIYW